MIKGLGVFKLALMGLISVAIPYILIQQAKMRSKAENKQSALEAEIIRLKEKIELNKNIYEFKLDQLQKKSTTVPININFPNGIPVSSNGGNTQTVTFPNDITLKYSGTENKTESIIKFPEKINIFNLGDTTNKSIDLTAAKNLINSLPKYKKINLCSISKKNNMDKNRQAFEKYLYALSANVNNSFSATIDHIRSQIDTECSSANIEYHNMISLILAQ